MVTEGMAQETAPLLFILGGMTGALVVASPSRWGELIFSGIRGIDILVLPLVDLEVLLPVGHGEATGLSSHFVGRKDCEGWLVLGGRQDDAAGIARLRRSIGRGDATAGGKGLGNDQIDLVGMTGGGDAQPTNANVLAVVLGLTGSTGQVGRFVNLDGAFVVEALTDASSIAIASGRKTAVGLVVSEDGSGCDC